MSQYGYTAWAMLVAMRQMNSHKPQRLLEKQMKLVSHYCGMSFYFFGLQESENIHKTKTSQLITSHEMNWRTCPPGPSFPGHVQPCASWFLLSSSGYQKNSFHLHSWPHSRHVKSTFDQTKNISPKAKWFKKTWAKRLKNSKRHEPKG